MRLNDEFVADLRLDDEAAHDLRLRDEFVADLRLDDEAATDLRLNELWIKASLVGGTLLSTCANSFACSPP